MQQDEKVPTERLVLAWPEGQRFNAANEDTFNENCNQAILAKGAELVAAGKRPWMEVWYAGIPGREDSTEADFDAVEIVDGQIATLPPYAELRSA